MTTSAGRTLHIIDAHLQTRGVPAATSITAVGEEKLIRSSNSRAPSNDGARKFSSQAIALLELHVHAAASGVDSNTLLRGRNADYHTGLI